MVQVLRLKCIDKKGNEEVKYLKSLNYFTREFTLTESQLDAAKYIDDDILLKKDAFIFASSGRFIPEAVVIHTL